MLKRELCHEPGFTQELLPMRTEVVIAIAYLPVGPKILDGSSSPLAVLHLYSKYPHCSFKLLATSCGKPGRPLYRISMSDGGFQRDNGKKGIMMEADVSGITPGSGTVVGVGEHIAWTLATAKIYHPQA